MTAPFGYEVRETEKRKEQEQSYKGYQKKYVSVDCTISSDGKLIPKTIHYDDMHKFEVDKVLEMREAASLKVGGCGIRYKVRIMNKETYIFFDDGEFKWFI
jgi:hypothetical protein